MIDKSRFVITIRSAYVTFLMVASVFGILGLSMVFGWMWFGAFWGTIAAVLFQFLLAFLLMPVVDHVRDTLYQDGAALCILFIDNLDGIDYETKEKIMAALRIHFRVRGF